MDTFNNNVQNNQNTNKQEATDNQEIKPTQNVSNQSESNKQNDAPSQSSDATDYSKVELSDRTSTNDVDNHHRNLSITDTDGHKITAQLQAPKYEDAEKIDDARQAVAYIDGQSLVTTTTARFHTQLFKLFHSLTVDGKPAGTLDWNFANEHTYEAFSWLMSQADSFLGSIFNSNK